MAGEKQKWPKSWLSWNWCGRRRTAVDFIVYFSFISYLNADYLIKFVCLNAVYNSINFFFHAAFSLHTAPHLITQHVVSILNESRKKKDFWHNFHLLCFHFFMSISFLSFSLFRFTHSYEEPFFVMIFFLLLFSLLKLSFAILFNNFLTCVYYQWWIKKRYFWIYTTCSIYFFS